MEKVGFSIRYKFLLLISALLVASVAAYLGLANHVFSEDKTQLVFDYNRSYVSNLSSELNKVFESTADKLRLSGRLLAKQSAGGTLVEDLFVEDKNLAFLAIKKNKSNELRSLFWKKSFFISYGWENEELYKELQKTGNIPWDRIQKNGFHIWKPAAFAKLPLALFARTESFMESGRLKNYVFIAAVRLDQLGIQSNQNQFSEVFLLNSAGELLFSESELDSKTRQELLSKSAEKNVKASVFRFQGDEKEYLAAYSKAFSSKLIVFSRVSTAKAFAVVKNFIYRSALFASIFLTLGFLIAILFSRSLTRPIDRLLGAMRKVASGDLSISIRLKTKDEIRILAENFNQMISDLRASRNELEEINRELEAKVKERTRQLEEQNLAVKNAQEALLKTSRLAAAGEIAGRAAHEVLNPLTSILTRIQKMDKRIEEREQGEIRLLEDITTAWNSDLAEGKDKLWDEWNKASELDPSKSLLEEDLENVDHIRGKMFQEITELKTDLGFLMGEGRRINRIVQSMRSLNRTSGDKLPHSLSGLLDESFKIMADSMDELNIHFSRTDISPNVEVVVDRDEFIQALTNLYRNSIQSLKLVDREQRTIRIEIPDIDKDKISVFVIDNGQGILEENQKKLFESQFSTKDSSEGTGLGLSISRRFIRSFDGDLVLASSTFGEGCRFKIELPNPAKQGRVSA